MLGFNGGTIGIANTVFTGTKSDDPNYSSVSLLLNGNETSGSDPNYSNVSLLLNGNTTFTDSSSYGHTVTPVGNAQISTAQSKFGGASMYFDGSGDYLTLANDASFVFGTGDFTVEMWVYHTSQNSQKIYYDGRPSSTNGAYVALYKTPQNKLALYVNTANRIVGTTSILQNAWYHIAVCRQGSSTKLFLNGIQEGSTFTDTTNYLNGTSRPIIGADGVNPSSSTQMQGYIDDLRITKGVARYTSNFTPPKAQLPGNTITDSSSNSHTVTPVGNARISTTQSKFGGASIYLDGSGDYLQSPTSTDFILGTNDFTLEAWIYPLGFADAPNYNNYGAIFDYRTANASQVNVLLSFLGNSTLVLYVNGSTRITGSAISTNQWTHVALTRSSGITRMFINGIQSGSSYSDTNSYVSSVFRIGGNINGDAFFNGYIDDLRITKGVARYTSNFNPPTAQLPGGETGTFASGLWTSSDHIKQIRNELWPGLVTSIVTDGLVVHLDAGNTASYPGSGNTWTDLSDNGNDATLFGTPSYTASPGYFDITSDSTYVRLSSYSHLTNNFTYSMWVRFDAFDTHDSLIENGSWTDTLLLRVESETSITVHAEGALRGTFTWDPSINTWYNVVFTRSGSTNTLYVNGTQSGSTFTDQTSINISNAYTFLMRSQHATNQFTNGQLAQYAMYNKALTPSEITQNFDALKGRYGL